MVEYVASKAESLPSAKKENNYTTVTVTEHSEVIPL